MIAGGTGAPAVGGGNVYVTYPCQYYGYNPTNGQLLWNTQEGCDGGGGTTPVYFGNQLWVRDPDLSFNSILDPQTGQSHGIFYATYAPTFFTSGKNGFGVSLVYDEISGTWTLGCFNTATRKQTWQFQGDGSLSTAPLMVGKYVIEGSLSGELYVLDEKTGKVASSLSVGTPIYGPNETTPEVQDFPLTGLAAAAGILVVPAGAQISAFVPK
jgi:outer membrane protein assembly factor BamB